MRVSLATLGCKSNQFDSAAIADLFRSAGHEIVPFGLPAEVAIINSCSVTAEAVRKSRQLVRRAQRARPETIVILTGCYAQTGTVEEINGLSGLALVVGPQDRARLPQLIEEYTATGRPCRIVRPIGAEPAFIDLPVQAFAEHTRAWLKIQDGCEQFCAYCQIPLSRGPIRSLPPPRVIAEATRLIAAGYREIVLTGIHLGTYGRDLPERPTLAEIVASLGALPGLDRLRLGSVEPNDITPALIDVLASTPTCCPHVHLPLQSGSDSVLAAMGRPYRGDEYARLTQALRAAIPGLAISTDLMVGFPGETEEDFADSLALVADLNLSRLHVFPFSPRPNTAAAGMPGQIPPRTRQARSRRAVALGRELSRRYHCSLIDRKLSVLVEQFADGYCRGLAGQYVEVGFASHIDLSNQIVAVTVRGADADRVTGDADGREPA